MPNITDPTALDEQLAPEEIKPSSQGSQVLSQAGYRVDRYYHQLGADVGGAVQELGEEYVKHRTTTDTLQSLKTEAAQEYQNQQTWGQLIAEDAAAPQSNPNLFQEKMLPILQEQAEQGSDAFSTQEGRQEYQRRMAERLNRWGEIANHDQGELTALNAHQAYQDTEHLAVASAAQTGSRGIQAGYDMLQERAKAALSVPGLSAAGAVAIRKDMEAGQERLAKTAAVADLLAAAEPNSGKRPSEVAAQLQNNPDIVEHLSDPGELTVVGERLDRQQDERIKSAAAFDKQKLELQGNQAYSDLQPQLYHADGTPNMDPAVDKQIDAFRAQFGAVLPHEYEALVKARREDTRNTENGVTPVDDQATRAGLYTRAFAGTLTDADVYAAQGAGKLTSKTGEDIRGIVKSGNDSPQLQPMRETFARVTGEFAREIMSNAAPLATGTPGQPMTVADFSLASHTDPTKVRQAADFQAFIGVRMAALITRDGAAKAYTEALDPQSKEFIGRFVPFFKNDAGSKWNSRQAISARRADIGVPPDTGGRSEVEAWYKSRGGN